MILDFVWEFRGAGLSIFGPVCSCRRRVTSEQHSCHSEFRSASAQVRVSLESPVGVARMDRKRRRLSIDENVQRLWHVQLCLHGPRCARHERGRCGFAHHLMV